MDGDNQRSVRTESVHRVALFKIENNAVRPKGNVPSIADCVVSEHGISLSIGDTKERGPNNDDQSFWVGVGLPCQGKVGPQTIEPLKNCVKCFEEKYLHLFFLDLPDALAPR